MYEDATYTDEQLDELLAAGFAVLGVEARRPHEGHQDDVPAHLFEVALKGMDAVEAVVEDGARDVEGLHGGLLSYEAPTRDAVEFAEVVGKLQVWINLCCGEGCGVEVDAVQAWLVEATGHHFPLDLEVLLYSTVEIEELLVRELLPSALSTRRVVGHLEVSIAIVAVVALFAVVLMVAVDIFVCRE